MHRFFVSSEDISDDEVVLRNQQARQISNVLRMRSGDEIIVLDNQGWQYRVVLQTIKSGEVVCRLVEKRAADGEPDVQITLYQSLIKRQKFEWVLQKCTEIGVTTFVPLVAERSIIKVPERVKSGKLTRWQRIILEAAEQSGRGCVPRLSSAMDLDKALSDIAVFDCSIVACPEDSGVRLRDVLGQSKQDGLFRIALFIGPEGGFTPEETKRSRLQGVISFGLGRRILRSETAALVSTSLVLYELGELEK